MPLCASELCFLCCHSSHDPNWEMYSKGALPKLNEAQAGDGARAAGRRNTAANGISTLNPLEEFAMLAFVLTNILRCPIWLRGIEVLAREDPGLDPGSTSPKDKRNVAWVDATKSLFKETPGTPRSAFALLTGIL